MNLAEHQPLWNSIQQFAFDEPNATITFSKKLANQQKWSPAFTERVIEEYRKFIFLCCISPTGASPSKAVDEAWHLHLTYTQSYWNAFCKKTLGKDIHHYPSTGGDIENHKHADWYAETLRLYGSVFGTKPPADIWPQPKEETQLTPEQRSGISKELLLFAGVLLLVPFVFNYFNTGKWSPFSVAGPQFLSFYAILVVTALIAHYLLRKDRLAVIKNAINTWSPRDMSVFQLTHIVYGKERSVQTSLVDLYRRGLVSVNENNRKIVVHRNNYQAPEKEENPLVPALLIKADNSSVQYKTITRGWYKKQSFEHSAITQLHSLTNRKESVFEKYGVIIIALFIGLARVMQGVINERPVALLVIEIVVLVMVAGIISNKFTMNTLVNDKLKALMLEKGGNKRLHADEVVNDYAINGKRVLELLPASVMLGSMFVLFPTTIMDRRRGDWDNSGDSNWGAGGSCSGGSSCGSDSSCGGGSGCGGCGGGD